MFAGDKFYSVFIIEQQSTIMSEISFENIFKINFMYEKKNAVT